MESINRREKAEGDAERDEGLGDLLSYKARLANARQEDGVSGIEEGFGES